MDKDYLIKKWLADELTAQESKAFEAMEEAPFLKEIVSDASAFKASHFSTVDDYQTFKQHLNAPQSPVRKLNWVRPLMRIASVFVLGFAVYFLFLNQSMTEIETQVGQKTSIVLPDSSLVFINASSEIGYNEKKWNKKREVKLEGEAFFDVAKGARFDVITPQGKVSVLGTEFNVKQRGNFFEVKCFEGTVRVTASSHHVILKEGDNFRIFQEIVTTGKNTYSVAQWTKNISDFQRVEVSEVFAEIERQYGVQVILENVDANQLFTGGFVHDNVNNALKSITEPLDLEYAILPNDNVRVQPREK